MISKPETARNINIAVQHAFSILDNKPSRTSPRRSHVPTNLVKDLKRYYDLDFYCKHSDTFKHQSLGSFDSAAQLKTQNTLHD